MTKRPTSVRQAAARGIRNALGLFLPFAVIAVALSQAPVTTDWATPERGAVAAQAETKAQRQYDQAMEKCQDLPANTLPGAAVIAWKGGAIDYTTDPKAVDLAFRIALGEHAPTRVTGVNLCR